MTMPSPFAATDADVAAAAPPVDDLEARQWLANVRRRLTGNTRDVERLGRYLLGRRLGAGGMGLVYEAHDPTLDRNVAIKVIASDRVGDEARLLREARALAELEHENVIEVYDVGVTTGTVYVVMELVEGVTLDVWAQRDPTLRERVEVLLAAGEGLAAAHRAAIVHRDVKPNNVMQRDDGRVCVLDFGLAIRSASASGPTTQGKVDVRASTLRSRGTVRGFSGTPAYAAPEQMRGIAADARSDQFSFCVTAAELLSGRLVGDVMRGTSWACDDAQAGLELLLQLVPRRYRPVLARGSSLDARDRYPNMDALLRALRRDELRARRNKTMAAGTLGVVALSLVGVTDEELPPCTQIVAAMAAPLRDEPGPPGRDQWVAQWSEARLRGCEDARREPSHHSVVSCLDRQRRTYEATRATAARVHDPRDRLAVWEVLPDPGDCASATATPPEGQRIQEQVAQSRLHHAAGELEAARHLALSSVRSARALEESLVLAEALATWGSIELELESYEEAARAFAESYGHAQRHRDDRLAARAALGMVETLVRRRAQDDDPQRWLRYATASQARSGDAELEIEVLRVAAMLARTRGELDEALQHLRAAYERLSADHRRGRALATVTHNLGSLYVLRGDYDEAIEFLEAARSSTESVLGPDHPRLAEIEADLGAAHLYRGDVDAAQQWLERARRRWDAQPSDKPEREAMTVTSIATVRWRKGDLTGAIEAYRDALKIFVDALGPDHPHVSQARDNLGVALFSAGQYDEALAEFLAAQVLAEERLGPNHPNVAKILTHVAQVYEARGAFDEAFDRAKRAADLAAATLGDRHGEVGHAVATLARIEIARERHADAAVFARRALSIYEEVGVGLLELAAARATLAYALAHAPQRPNCHGRSEACDDALRLAAQAGADYEAAGSAGASGLEALQAWAQPHFGPRWRG